MFHAVSLMYAPVTGFAVRVVPPTVSTSGSDPGRMTSFNTCLDEPTTEFNGPITPLSPVPATQVT